MSSSVNAIIQMTKYLTSKLSKQLHTNQNGFDMSKRPLNLFVMRYCAAQQLYFIYDHCELTEYLKWMPHYMSIYILAKQTNIAMARFSVYEFLNLNGTFFHEQFEMFTWLFPILFPLVSVCINFSIVFLSVFLFHRLNIKPGFSFKVLKKKSAW